MKITVAIDHAGDTCTLAFQVMQYHSHHMRDGKPQNQARQATVQPKHRHSQDLIRRIIKQARHRTHQQHQPKQRVNHPPKRVMPIPIWQRKPRKTQVKRICSRQRHPRQLRFQNLSRRPTGQLQRRKRQQRSTSQQSHSPISFQPNAYSASGLIFLPHCSIWTSARFSIEY